MSIRLHVVTPKCGLDDPGNPMRIGPSAEDHQLAYHGYECHAPKARRFAYARCGDSSPAAVMPSNRVMLRHDIAVRFWELEGIAWTPSPPVRTSLAQLRSGQLSERNLAFEWVQTVWCGECLKVPSYIGLRFPPPVWCSYGELPHYLMPSSGDQFIASDPIWVSRESLHGLHGLDMLHSQLFLDGKLWELLEPLLDPRYFKVTTLDVPCTTESPTSAGHETEMCRRMWRLSPRNVPAFHGRGPDFHLESSQVGPRQLIRSDWELPAVCLPDGFLVIREDVIGSADPTLLLPGEAVSVRVDGSNARREHARPTLGYRLMHQPSASGGWSGALPHFKLGPSGPALPGMPNRIIVTGCWLERNPIFRFAGRVCIGREEIWKLLEPHIDPQFFEVEHWEIGLARTKTPTPASPAPHPPPSLESAPSERAHPFE